MTDDTNTVTTAQLFEMEIAAMRQRLVKMEATALALSTTMPAEARRRGWVPRLAAAIADEWDVSVADVMGTTRLAIVCRPRFVLCWAIKHASGCSNAHAAALSGYQDHTSAIHACRRVEAWRATEEGFCDLTDRVLALARRLRDEALVAQRPRYAVADLARPQVPA